jgi:hypothetical protein
MMFTRDDLNRAYESYAKRYGRGRAVDAVDEATGTMFVGQVPENKFVDTIAALTGSPAANRRKFKAAAQASPGERLKHVHDALNAMARSIYTSRASRP